MTTLTGTMATPWQRLRAGLRAYGVLVKSLQTGLLLLTGLAGYTSTRSPTASWGVLLMLCGSLALAISGSTVLNMVYDQDIDAMMKRTTGRPLPSGQLTKWQALSFGLVLSVAGVGWAAALAPLYGLLVLAGFAFDVVVYTVWLKRRTPWSIVWGGIAGGMPILAGRALGIGRVDWIGLVLAMAVLFWIPTHMLTFSMKYAAEYQQARVPVFPNCYGEQATRWMIALSTALAVVALVTAVEGIGLGVGYLGAAIGLGIVLLGFTAATVYCRSPRLNYWLYKLASLYMLGSMVLIAAGVMAG